jgi:16S rRNA (guanine1516-N2)-methyltransferase
MYPSTEKAALPKKELQILRELIGPDLDSAVILDLARRTAQDRVVVKRPSKAEPLAVPVSWTVESKLVRFDIYKR